MKDGMGVGVEGVDKPPREDEYKEHPKGCDNGDEKVDG